MTRVREMTSARIAATIAVTAALMHAHVPTAGAASEDPVTPGATAGVHQPAIDALEAVEEVNVLAGIGCAPDPQGAQGAQSDGLCPEEPLTRWQAAVLLVRMVDRADPQNAIPGWSRYRDVGSEWWAAHVERAADLGITSECSSRPLRFCPHSEVSRAQMSTLLVKAFDLPQAQAAAGFIDVPADHAFAQDIDRLAAARVTAGCQRDPARYCPERALTRGQAASLAARAAGLLEPAASVEPYPYRPAADPTPLPVDPAVRAGSLANGLTYYLRNNDSPGSNLELILTVRAGSVNEPAPGLGLAHFLEHMLFRGTEDYPGRLLHDALRDLGLEVGPDVNATVGYDHTSLTFSLVGDDSEGVRQAFELLSQMAFAATLSDEAVEAERGVVLDELRLSTESAAGAISSEFDRIYTSGTRYAGRRPIGTRAGIRSVMPDDLRRFYSRWFVPSNMAVVAVGDWPLDDLQAHLEEYFGSAEAGEAPAMPRSAAVPDGTPASHVVTDPQNAFSYISLDIPMPVHDTGTVGGQRAWLAETLIGVMLNTRLREAFERGELSQVDTPSIEFFSHNDGLRYLGTNWRGENLARASTDYLTVLLTATEHGFTDDDAARAAERLRAALQFQLDSTGTVQDIQYAQRYLAHFQRGTDISGAESRNKRLLGLLDDLTAAELTAHYRWLMDRSAPIAIAVGPDAASVPTPQQLTAALAAATAGPPPEQTEAIEELVAAPAPADIVNTRTLTSLNGVEWTFDNGARVIFVKSGIAESSVNLRAVSLGGWSLLEPGDRSLAQSAVSAVLGSGFGDLSRQQVGRYLETRTASLGAFIAETTEGFTGSASAADTETLFQLLHLAVTAPRIDREAYNEALNVAAIKAAQSEVNPAWQAWVAYNEARFDPAWHRPVARRDQLASLSAEQLLELYRERLGKVDDLVVAVAGDIDAAEVERLARHYIGTLPAGAADTYADRRPAMPAGAVRRDVAVDASESAVVEIYHEWSGPLTPRLRAAAALLEAVLERRLYTEIREELGDTYVTSVSVTPRFTPQPAIDSTVTVTAEAGRVEEIRSRVLSILASVAAAGAGDESLAEALASVESDNRLISNQTVLETLTETHFMDEKDLFTPLRRLALAATLTASDVRSLAARLYQQGGRIEIVRTPTG